MLQKPNMVFVGKQVNLAGTSPAIGDVWVLNAETGAAMDISSTTAITGDAIKIAFKKLDGSVVTSAPISKNGITHMTPDAGGAYAAPVEATATIDFAGVTPVIGYRYVIRCIYRDIYEHPGQFTHSYEYIATTTDPTDLATAFVALVNNHKGARVTAALSTDAVVLTAKSVTTYGFATQGKEAITPYSQVMLKPVVYYTNPSQFTSVKAAVPGVTIVNTESKPGKGNAYIIRDREQAALGYKGITYRTEFPVIKPELNVNLSETYDTLVIEFENKYQSPDNQYVKSTALALEVYVEAGATAAAEALGDKIRAWIVA